MNNIEENICEAIDILVDKAISQAKFDRTIQANIIECVDKTIGKYKISYQDSTFYAYTNNSDITYTNGASVYILIPENNMSRDKTILGTVEKLGINYISTAVGEESYEKVGINCIKSDRTFELCSYGGDISITLYQKDKSDNLINIDNISLNEYIKSSAAIVIAANFRTQLDIKQQYNGNYGIAFALNFLDNTGNTVVTRTYTLDINKMSGTPYKYNKKTRQYGIFNIDTENFIDIESVNIFAYDFPNTNNSITESDIFISDIELYGTVPLTQEEINGYSLSILTPQGTFFDNTSIADSYKILQAEVKVKGKIVDFNSQKLTFYWFAENVGINQQSQYYNKYGGQGWKCLNNYNIISTDPLTIEWIGGQDNFKVLFSDTIAKENKYKCVVLYDNTVLSKDIVIYNYNSDWEITIESDKGTQFFYDSGYPTLTCNVKTSNTNTQLKYSWGVVDNTNTFSSLAETVDYNIEYNNALQEYNQLLDDIKNGIVYPEASKEKLNELKTIIDKYDNIIIKENGLVDYPITRIEKNKIYHLDVNIITNFCTYKCSVFAGENNVYIGTASIIITNELKSEKKESLIINNGTQVFKYNEKGVSPTSASLDNPQSISALTFTVYNDVGQEITEDVLKNCEIQWIVPINNTLLIIPKEYENEQDIIDIENNVRIYNSKILNFSYEIVKTYDITKVNNNIKLKVNYKGNILTAETNFTFLKEGENGTNGTEYVCKIVPNVKSGYSIPYYISIDENNVCNYVLPDDSGNSDIGYKFFKIELWKNGELIFSGLESGTSEEGKEIKIEWGVMGNRYTSSIADVSQFILKNKEKGYFIKTFKPIYTYDDNVSFVDIIKSTIEYDNLIFYPCLPVIYSTTYNSSDRKIELVDFTGFMSVLYNSSGQQPTYNSNAFELKVLEKIGDYYEDISLSDDIKYEWTIKGSIYDTVLEQWKSEILLEEVTAKTMTEKLQKNQKLFKPVEKYDGQCLSCVIRCKIYKKDSAFGDIWIPIYFSLNRFGLANINAWDGNSIQINEDGGFILAPQVGAGEKDENNRFTGILIGTVQESGYSEKENGLFGYHEGQRSIFLDAKTGKAEFGKTGRSQIIFDPSSNKAQIYSGNYSKENGTGMLIDLTTPAINFGSGNFSVDEYGKLKATQASIEGNLSAETGSIGGWKIENGKLMSDYEKDENGEKITVVTAVQAANENRKWVFAAGGRTHSDYSSCPFRVDKDGNLYAASGQIGGWNLTSNKLFATASGKVSVMQAPSSDITWVFAAGGTTHDNYEDCPFRVNKYGNMYASSGKIGGWDINTNSLSANGITINANGSISANGWSLSSGGTANFDNITIKGGSGLFDKSFDVTGTAKDTFDKLVADVISAKFIEALEVNFVKGKIGGFTITDSTIESEQLGGEYGMVTQLILQSTSSREEPCIAIHNSGGLYYGQGNLFSVDRAGRLSCTDISIVYTDSSGNLKEKSLIEYIKQQLPELNNLSDIETEQNEI